MFELMDAQSSTAVIKVIGVGGGGGNALNTMIDSGLAGVQFIAANTDAQALKHNRATTRVQLGAEITRGLGCGANPDRGRASAIEARDRLRERFLPPLPWLWSPLRALGRTTRRRRSSIWRRGSK